MSLIEVMIALGLAALLMTGAFALVASQRRSYTTQSAIAKRQQELWVGLEFITRDLRKAGMGFGFCRTVVGAITYAGMVDCNPNGAGSVQVLRPLDIADGGTTATDSMTIRYGEPPGNGAPDATLNAAYVTWSGASSLSMTLLNPTTAPATFMSPIGCSCSGGVACTAFSTPVFALVYANGAPTTTCSVVQITGATCGSTLTVQPRPTIGACVAPPTGYTPASTRTYPATSTTIENLGTLRSITYAIDATDASTPKLTRNQNDGTGVQVIALGIEDLQIVPTCDVNNNGFIDAEGNAAGPKATDEWFNNTGGDTANTTCTTYPQIRVSMIARTAQAAPGFTGAGRPALENRAAAATADNFHRRVLSTTVATPNLAL